MDNFEQQIVNQISQQQYQELSHQLTQNKNMMMKILTQNPKVGVYKNQTQQDWKIFFDFYINFLQSQVGPRGQCSKLIRQELLSKQEYINKVLKPFGLSASTHIRSIYMKIKSFSPCPQYEQYLKLQQVSEKSINTLNLLKDETSQLSKSIKKGLTSKHGEQYDIDSYTKLLQDNYITKIQSCHQQMQKLKLNMNESQIYHQFIEAKKVMEPYFKMWNEVDSNMGKQNLKTGKLFEEKVARMMIPYLLKRQLMDKNWIYSNKKLQVFTNLSWIPRNLGQIDIAFGYKDQKQDRYYICTLIECKSRLFDLRQAFKQVSLEQQEPNKGPTFQELKLLKQLNKFKVKQKKQKKIKIKQQGQIIELNTGEKQTKEYNQEQNQQQAKQKQIEQKIGHNNKILQQQLRQKLVKLKENKQKLLNNKKFLNTKYGGAQLVENHHFYIVTSLPLNIFLLPIQSKMKQAIQKHTKNLFTEQIESVKLYPYLKQKFQSTQSPLDWICNYQKQFNHDKESNILVLK